MSRIASEGRVLIVSGAAAERRFSLHPLAKAFAGIVGQVNHLVLGSSGGSRLQSRGSDSSAVQGAAGPIDGVRRLHCNMTPFPPKPNGSIAGWLRSAAVDRWACQPCGELDLLAPPADQILVQSGEAAAMTVRLHRAAPQATISYVATEPACSTHPRLEDLLARDGHIFDRAVALVPDLGSDLEPFASRALHLPPPLDPQIDDRADSSPYPAGANVVVFADRGVDNVIVRIMASSFPEVGFVLVGSTGASVEANLSTVGSLSESALFPYVAHAQAAVIACPESTDGPQTDLARPLAILRHLGIPTVCPVSLGSGYGQRFAYDPARTSSLREALGLALQARTSRIRPTASSWADLACLLAGPLLDRVATRSPSEILHAG